MPHSFRAGVWQEWDDGQWQNDGQLQGQWQGGGRWQGGEGGGQWEPSTQQQDVAGNDGPAESTPTEAPVEEPPAKATPMKTEPSSGARSAPTAMMDDPEAVRADREAWLAKQKQALEATQWPPNQRHHQPRR